MVVKRDADPTMVVEAKPTPLGPMLMVSPSTMVVGLAEGPILYVVPEITTSEAPTPTVRSPTAVVVKLDPDPIRVVEAKPTPLGPMLMVSPSTTTVVGLAEGPILYVVPEITTWEAPTPTVRSPTAVVVKPDPDPIRVMEAKPTPPGPMLMVSPLTTIVVGVAEGPRE